MARQTLFMETTSIESAATAAQIQAFLAQAGAAKILSSYSKGEIIGIHFILNINGSEVPFQLPVRVDPIFRILQKNRSSAWAYVEKDRAQAKRVAWRQVYRWVQAQIALIQTGMVEPAEVFAPYMQVGPEETLYQKLKAGNFQALLPEKAGGEN